jgi:hypothetical protein
MIVMSVCSILFVDLLLFRFDGFWKMCVENSCNVFMLFFMVVWVPIFATLGSADVVACLHVPRALAFGIFPSFLLFAW